eukprot:gene20330-27090_t
MRAEAARQMDSHQEPLAARHYVLLLALDHRRSASDASFPATSTDKHRSQRDCGDRNKQHPRTTGGYKQHALTDRGGRQYIDTRGLNRQLADSRDTDELQTLYYKNRHHLDHIHLAALMGSLAKATSGSDVATPSDRVGRYLQPASSPQSSFEALATFKSHLFQSIIEQQQRMAPRQSSNILWAIAKWESSGAGQSRVGQGYGSLPPTYDCMQSMVNQLVKRLPEASSQDLAQLLSRLSQLLPACRNGQDMSMAIYALARLCHRPADPLWLPNFEQSSLHLVGSCSGQTLANTIWAMGELRHRPRPPWSQAFVTALLPKMRTLHNSELSITARTIVALGMKVLERMLSMNTQDLALCMAAMAALGARPGRELLACLSMRLVAPDPHSSDLHYRPSAQPKDVGQACGHTPSDVSLSSSVPGQDGRGHAEEAGPAVSTQSKASPKAERVRAWSYPEGQDDGLNSQATHMILRALAHMQVMPSEAFMSSVLSSVTPRLHRKTNPQDLMLLLHALATLRYHPPTRFMMRFLQHSRAILPHYSPKHLAGTFYALGRLNMKPEKRWMEAALSKVLDSFPDFGPHEVANIVWALARMGYTPTEPWKATCFARIMVLLPAFSAAELSMLLEAVARAHFSPPPGWLPSIQAELSARVVHSRQAGMSASAPPYAIDRAASAAEQGTGQSAQLWIERQRRRNFMGAAEFYKSLRALSVLSAEGRQSVEALPRLQAGTTSGTTAEIARARTPLLQGTNLLVFRGSRTARAGTLPKWSTNVPAVIWTGETTTMVADAASLASLTRLRQSRSSSGGLEVRVKRRRRLVVSSSPLSLVLGGVMRILPTSINLDC